MLRADAMMDAVEPGLQIAEDEVADWQEFLGYFRIAAFGDRMVVITTRPQAAIAAPIVGNDQRTRQNGTFDEATQRVGAAVSGDGKTKTTGIAAVPPLVLYGARLPVANLDGGRDQRLVVYAPTFVAGPSTDPHLIDFDMLLRSRADTVLIGPHHARTEFVQNLEGGLITGQPELALELHGRHAGRLAGNKVCCPEPRRKRRVAAFHDRADRQAGILPAGAAAQDARTVLEAKRGADHTTMRANETRIPACLFQVCRARRVIRKKLLKFRQSLRERQIGVLLDVHSGHGCLTYPVTTTIKAAPNWAQTGY